MKQPDWEAPSSTLFDHFGKTSVNLFFMITAFLFFTKLIESKTKPVDWLRLFVSRICRLYPVYLLGLAIMIVIIFILSQWKLQDSKTDLATELFEWVTFTLSGNRAINNFEKFYLINAGVTWSLIYEWLFYFSLPLIGFLFFRTKASILTILITVSLGIWVYLGNAIRLIHIYPFAGGIAASYLVQSQNFARLFQGKYFQSLQCFFFLQSFIFSILQ